MQAVRADAFPQGFCAADAPAQLVTESQVEACPTNQRGWACPAPAGVFQLLGRQHRVVRRRNRSRRNITGAYFLTRDRLSKSAFLAGAGNLIAALQCFIYENAVALRTSIAVVFRPTRDQRWIPISRRALICSVIAAAIEHLAASRLLLDNFAATAFARADDAGCFENRSLLSTLFRRAS